jgi:uncharacterized protein
MSTGVRITAFATNRPRLITALLVVVAVLLIALAALPSLWPKTFPMLHPVAVDTDPENMLSRDEAVRVFHGEMKRVLALHDIVVVGVVNETHPNGVFNAASLGRIYELTEFAKTLRGEAIGEEDPKAGVVEVDVIAPSTVDNIEQGGLGVVRFEWLMSTPPETDAEALAIRDKALRLPFLNGTLVSEDGRAIALYLPLTAKDLSHAVYTRLRSRIADFEGDDAFHITGLPVAEDTFGVEMFIQMAISAPLAMLVIFLLMLVFFRKLVLVVSPMIVAMTSVIITMGLLIATGNTIHIMSSMIPIFIMPIAVLDSIHILSEFFDRYQGTKDRRETIRQVMDALFVPMLYTSLTSAAGFGSLALTPIPPVQVFGMFVALGIMTAWLLTIVFIPAYIMLIPERSLENFGARHGAAEEEAQRHTPLGRFLGGAGGLTFRWPRVILALALLAVVVAFYGISRIEINDNPTRWFHANHPIRVADRVLNDHFGGTYMAYLALRAPAVEQSVVNYAPGLLERLETQLLDVAELAPDALGVDASARQDIEAIPAEAASIDALLDVLYERWDERALASQGDTAYAWEELLAFLDAERQRDEILKQPEVLRYVAALQDYLLATGVVGKSNSIADIVKTVHRELFEGAEEAYRLPDSANAVAQCLITYESSHRPHDLWHFITPDYRQSSIWVQMKSGDNRDMSHVVRAVDAYIAENPPPLGLEFDWFGLTYINVIWQEKMVSGMLQAFLGSFLVVFLMMTVLFRSALWGLLSMIPLTVTIGLIYGVIGLVGKDYDMPVAVLSSLTLGLAVDFAIHFLARSRSLYETHGSWKAAYPHTFGEPARAIARNVIVIAVGFLPLLFASLVPYQIVGVLLAAILLVSGIGTLLILPSLIRVAEPLLFPKTRGLAFTCKWGTCVVSAGALVAFISVNAHQFFGVAWSTLALASAISVPILAGLCGITSRRETCKVYPAPPEGS